MNIHVFSFVAIRGITALRRFFYHWYILAWHYYWGSVAGFIAVFDRTIALRVTARYLFRPLYQDYSLFGYLFGVCARMIRLLIGLVVYGVIMVSAIVLYSLWFFLPLYCIMRIIV